LQISNGFAYSRDEDEDPDLQLCTELHEVKLDDIESVLEETGEPLVVVYYFKANLEQLKRRFKKRLVELDKNGKAQDAWNAGKVEILALQYRKGAMGLSLQHGGRNIYLMTPTFIADDYAQVLERLGPLRQMQSGYNRVVNVFRCISRKSEDARVFAVAEGKIALETALVEMIRDA
jgi:SNF2 family DNA or RNA helicase